MRLLAHINAEEKLNILNAQEELLDWHTIFGHYNIRETQKMFKTIGENLFPIISPKLPASTCSIPLCRSYLLGKVRLTSTQSKTSTPTPKNADVIKVKDLLPGDCVSTDQHKCRIKGRLQNTRGKEEKRKRGPPENVLWGNNTCGPCYIKNGCDASSITWGFGYS